MNVNETHAKNTHVSKIDHFWIKIIGFLFETSQFQKYFFSFNQPVFEYFSKLAVFIKKILKYRILEYHKEFFLSKILKNKNVMLCQNLSFFSIITLFGTKSGMFD